MEKYYGLSINTLQQMRSEFLSLLTDTVKENTQYPTDRTLYVRVINLSTNIRELTEELENRYDEHIKDD